MPKYDAFGREIGEDTLSGLGGSDRSASAPPRAEPAAAPGPLPHEATPAVPAARAGRAAPARVRPQRRSGARRLRGLIGLAAVMAVPVIGITGLVGNDDAVERATRALETQAPDGLDAPAGPPSGISGRSVIARANFARALRKLDGVGAIAYLRLSPDRAEALVVEGGTRRTAVVDFEGALERGGAFPAGQTSRRTIRASGIDPAAPARLVRGAAQRFAVKARDIRFLVLTFTPDGHQWLAYFERGVYVQGDEQGRVIRRLG